MRSDKILTTDGHRWTQMFNHNAENAEGEPPILLFSVLFVFFVVNCFAYLCSSVRLCG